MPSTHGKSPCPEGREERERDKGPNHPTEALLSTCPHQPTFSTHTLLRERQKEGPYFRSLTCKINVSLEMPLTVNLLQAWLRATQRGPENICRVEWIFQPLKCLLQSLRVPLSNPNRPAWIAQEGAWLPWSARLRVRPSPRSISFWSSGRATTSGAPPVAECEDGAYDIASRGSKNPFLTRRKMWTWASVPGMKNSPGAASLPDLGPCAKP